jgi:HrpA-like RNA helicase
MKIGSDISKSDFTVENTIEMFTQFIEPPKESYIIDGFDYSFGSGLISKEGLLTQIGKLIIDSRLDVMDGLTMLYAYNISSIAFKNVFKIISICSYLKSGLDDFFYNDINPDTKTNILNRFKKTSSSSEHILLYQIYKFIESDPNESIFNLELYKKIEQIYSNQIDKITRIYEKANILIDVIKKDLDHNIICAFNYGYKVNRAFRRGKEFKFNNITCNFNKAIFDYSTYSSIIFYSNILTNGKFNIRICSPYLLE